MKIEMTETRDVGTYGLHVAGAQYDDLPDDVCKQLIDQGIAIEAKSKATYRKPYPSEE